MISKLLLMHNIKYIICVDDCFFARKREEMEAVVFGEMCSSMNPFMRVLESANQSEAVAEISAMLSIGVDASTLVYPLLRRLKDEELLKCYEICEVNGTTYTEERDSIIFFLDELKREGKITDFIMYSSTIEASSFNAQTADMTDGAILWLLDRNFSRVGESEDSGLRLAEDIISRENVNQNYVYILSAIGPGDGLAENDVEEEFDRLLVSHGLQDNRSFIYYISKSRLQTKNREKIAKSLAQGFKRKACFELFRVFCDCLFDGVTIATTKVQEIRQKTLNFLFANKASVLL